MKKKPKNISHEMKYILQKEKELKEIVFCKCGKLKEYDYEGDTICPVFSDIIKDDISGKAWDENHIKHHNGKDACWGDLSIYEFIQELKK